MSAESDRLTHVNAVGEANMVDVSAKHVTSRVAEARGRVLLQAETLRLIRENAAAKGDVLAVARVAGIMAAKRTSELIPLCHGLPLSSVDIEFTLGDEPSAVDIVATARTSAQTGVEMEAMMAVSVAGLTIYDMCKAVDRGMRLTEVRVTYKAGGKSGEFTAP
jgi:cyclic pyranopterin monophosphate synthase